MNELIVHSVGPACTVQDGGWSGTLQFGLSQGGAADRRALAENWALLGEQGCAVIEMAGMGGRFSVKKDARIALTGAAMGARLDGEALGWNAVHAIGAGQMLDIGAAQDGVFGYLGLSGGIDLPAVMGARSTHRGAGLGHVLAAGDHLPLGPDHAPERVGLGLPPAEAARGSVRMVPTAQTGLFGGDTIARFEATVFRRSARGNRQGIALESVENFALQGGQTIVSETVIPGDIQVPGDGTPMVLLADCQTTGGYPRLAAILPCDLHRVAQAPAGAELRFRMITREEGIAAEQAEAKARATLSRACLPLIRNPADIRDLLGYQLISGVVAGEEK